MAKQTPKQSLACHRNWFKFKLAGMYFPFDKESLTSEEYEKWNKMQEIRNSLLENFEKNSIAKGLKVVKRCWCKKPAKYPNPNKYSYFADKYPLVCKKHSVDE